MSQQNINQSMPNGLPPNWCGTVPPQKNPNFSPYTVNNNGVNSSQSSRDSSPAARFSTIPTSQLPPTRGNIPVSQLPPNRSGVSPVPYNLGAMSNSSNGHTNSSATQSPNSSPKVTNLNARLPNVNAGKPNDVSSVVNTSVQQNKSSYLQSDIQNVTSGAVNNLPTNYTFNSSNSNPPTSIKSNMPLTPQPPINVSSNIKPNLPLQSSPNVTPTSQSYQNVSSNISNQIPPTNVPMNVRSNMPLQQTTSPVVTTSQSPQNIPSNYVSNAYNPNPPINTPMIAKPNMPVQSPPVSTSSISQLPQNTSPLSTTSTPTSHQNVTPVKQDLNQPQKVARPPGLGPALPTNEIPKVQSDNQFQQLPLRIPQQQPPQQQQAPSTYNPSGPGGPQQMQRPPGPVDNRPAFPSNMNYPAQNQNIRPPMPNMYNSNVSTAPPPLPPVSAPTGPSSMGNYPPTSASSLHTKRYPQYPNQNYPVTNQQQTNVYPTNTNVSQPNYNVPPTTNNYHNQQPSANVYNAQQQQQQQQPPLPQQQYYQQQQQLPPPPPPSQTNTYNQQPQQTNMYNQQQQQPQPPPPQQYSQNYQQQANQQRNYQQMTQQMQNMNIVKTGFNKAWGHENYDLLQCPNVLPEEAIEAPKVRLGQEFLDAANCSPDIFRCTMTKIPESNSLLQKSRLPLGVLIHPFKDLNHLPVIQCNTIVRCRSCRTYINPFIFFVDTKRWKCNLCYRVNELPEEFQYDPVSKSYGDPSRRPEIKSSTIEYIAPSEYMLRPPQPAVYLFLLDISRLAIESGYLHTICEILSSQLTSLPGDARTQIGFIAYNSTLHFYSLAEGLSQPHEMIVSDIDDVFLPCPEYLLVNLKEHIELVSDLLNQLPNRYQHSFDNGSALGAALQAAFKMMSSTGGRVTVFQVSLPMLGPGALTVREDPNQRAGKEAPHLNPATDFYKRLALDCSGHQIAVDLFVLNSQYADIATLSGISRFSGGCMYHFPLFKASKPVHAGTLERCFKRYLTRKIGFEAVMRIRCTRGLAIHTFHGNFFVRSTDLLSLPNINPDAGFGMQVSIEENLADLQSVCFQAALLYTSSKGERRIRVHTLCLPVVSTLSDVLNSADQQCIVGILSKMAVDRSLQSSLSDARDAFINVAIDILSSYKLSLNMGSTTSGLMAPQCLKLLPLYILALLKCTAFRTGQSTRLDDRVFAMCDMKTLPLLQLMQHVYPDLYPIYRLAECPQIVDNEGIPIPQPRRLQLTARNIDSHGAYLLDAGQQMIIYVCPNVSQQFLIHCLGVPNYNSIPDQCYELQQLENPDNQRLHAFIANLNEEKPYPATLQIIRDNSPNRTLLIERLVEDRIEFALSYNEFLQHLKTQVK